jgi:hypothetical protein
MTLRSCIVAGWLGCMGATAGVPVALAQDVEQEIPRRVVTESDAPAMSNQQKADAIVAAIEGNPALRAYQIDVVVTGNVAELQGQVVDAQQREIAQQVALSIPGIVRIDNRLTLITENIRPVQDVVPNLPPGGFVPPAPGFAAPPPGFMPPPGFVPPQGPNVGVPGNPAAMQLIPNAQGPGEPAAMPTGRPGMLPNPMYQPPPLPPYAWPTYAPYNNYSRVAHPLHYSGSQWPFIGPMYPYPKVPLGWRRVTLEWQDGSWWYGRESNGRDWWRVRYW